MITISGAPDANVFFVHGLSRNEAKRVGLWFRERGAIVVVHTDAVRVEAGWPSLRYWLRQLAEAPGLRGMPIEEYLTAVLAGEIEGVISS